MRSSSTSATFFGHKSKGKVNKMFKDIFRETMQPPDENKSQYQAYSPNKMVRINDYTKNISQSIF